MDVTLHLPDDLADRLGSFGDLPRRALEAFALEELRAHRISEVELGRLLDLARLERDGFLKAHGIEQNYTMDDFEEERRTLKSLGL